MRVLHLHRKLPPYKYMLDLSLELAQRPEVDLRLYTPTASGLSGSVKGIKTGSLQGSTRGPAARLKSGLRNRYYRQIKRTDLLPFEHDLVRQSFDIVHIQRYFLTKLFDRHLEQLGKRIKFVLTMRGNDTYLTPWLSDYWRNFYRNRHACISAFQTVSEHQADYLAEHWGVPREKIRPIYPNVDTSKFTFRGERTPSTDPVKICSVFRLCWEKSLTTNLRAVALLKESGRNVKYTIYGKGEQEGELHYMADRLGLSEDVDFKGYINSEDLPAALAEHDIYLQLSASESFGATVTEAQAIGLPAVVSDTGGLPETVEDGRTGRVIPFFEPEKAAEAIAALIDDPEQYKTYSKAAAERISRKFSIAAEAEATLEMYKRILT